MTWHIYPGMGYFGTLQSRKIFYLLMSSDFVPNPKEVALLLNMDGFSYNDWLFYKRKKYFGYLISGNLDALVNENMALDFDVFMGERLIASNEDSFF